MNKMRLCLFLVVLLTTINNGLQAQLKIGYQAKTLSAPNITLLEIANDPTAVTGKGLMLPMVTNNQRNAMPNANGGQLPAGLSVYNTDQDALQVYSSNKSAWVSFKPSETNVKQVKSSPTSTTAYIQGSFDGVNKVFGLTYNNFNITANGLVTIVYNHIPLKNGSDFLLDVANKRITFLTIVPESFEEFDTFTVEYDL